MNLSFAFKRVKYVLAPLIIFARTAGPPALCGEQGVYCTSQKKRLINSGHINYLIN